MLSQVFITLLIIKSALCQINGEFWWLHEKVAQLQHVEPPPPKIEDINEFETDESVKITFVDRHSSEKIGDDNINKLVKNDIVPIYFEDQTELVKPNLIKINIITNNNTKENQNKTDTLSNMNLRKETTTISNKDEFQFIFPENKHLWKENFKNGTQNNASVESNITKESTKIRRHNKMILNDKIWYEEDNKQTETEAICTFITAHECILNNGFVHMPGFCPKNNLSDKRKICCILPITLSKPPNNNLLYKRHKRSDPGETNIGLKQRNALLQRKYHSHVQELKLTTTTSLSKPVENIVTQGDYTDPYWNIKNSKFRKPNIPSHDNHDYTNSKYDGTPDYSEIYGVELPKPGLIGLYSDNDDIITSWKLKGNKGFHYGDVEESDEDDNGGGFGYATIDPRLGKRKSAVVLPISRHPQRVMTPATDDSVENPGSHVIHFHSNPDFHVLEGFKLINLAGNKNELFRKAYTENVRESEEDPLIEQTSPIITNSDYSYDDILDMEHKIFQNCGKYNIKSVNKDNVDSRCDPWLAIVVLTKSPHNFLCYATIVHPKAAITVANCVNGKATGEVSVRAGVWNLNDRTNSQYRMSSIHTHPQFSPGDVSNDLAVLHWKRPLRLQANVLPACLGNPHVGDECYFVGWGGYDQALLPRPKWQPATILTPRNCGEKISTPEVSVPDDAFCAKVKTRGTVTGVGGPLLCKAGNRISIVGVAVYREDVVILLPTFEWVTNVLHQLQIV